MAELTTDLRDELRDSISKSYTVSQKLNDHMKKFIESPADFHVVIEAARYFEPRHNQNHVEARFHYAQCILHSENAKTNHVEIRGREIV
jgi:hypothetical protein